MADNVRKLEKTETLDTTAAKAQRKYHAHKANTVKQEYAKAADHGKRDGKRYVRDYFRESDKGKTPRQIVEECLDVEIDPADLALD